VVIGVLVIGYRDPREFDDAERDTKIWMNGRLVEWKDATIHIASHVIHYGSGVFEGRALLRDAARSACFRLDAPHARLQHSPKIYRMEYALDLAGWQHAVLDTIRANR
jgi:branched-chain amino acid aminotransferase